MLRHGAHNWERELRPLNGELQQQSKRRSTSRRTRIAVVYVTQYVRGCEHSSEEGPHLGFRQSFMCLLHFLGPGVFPMAPDQNSVQFGGSGSS